MLTYSEDQCNCCYELSIFLSSSINKPPPHIFWQRYGFLNFWVHYLKAGSHVLENNQKEIYIKITIDSKIVFKVSILIFISLLQNLPSQLSSRHEIQTDNRCSVFRGQGFGGCPQSSTAQGMLFSSFQIALVFRLMDSLVPNLHAIVR